MRHSISDLLDTYVDESVDLNGDTPLSASRIEELTMKRMSQKSGIKIPAGGKGRICGPLSRYVLVAAVVISICCLTAFAIAVSLRDAARRDMGISTQDPIPEWTEYEGIDQADTNAAGEDPRVALMATMCSGNQLYGYLEVSPVPEEAAEAILTGDASPQYEWDLSGIDPAGCGYLAEQTGYDPETQTALVKVHIHGERLEAVSQVELKLALMHELNQMEVYGPVVIPVTPSESISCPADAAVVNTKVHFERAWRAGSEPLHIADYISEGHIRQISIYAGYIEVELETPDIAQWLMESSAEQVNIEVPPELVDQDIREIMFYNNWITSVNEALEDATLNYKDGTCTLIDEMPRDYAAAWHLDSDHMDLALEGKQIYRFVPKQAIDLSAVRSITVCGIEYSFSGIDEAGF